MFTVCVAKPDERRGSAEPDGDKRNGSWYDEQFHYSVLHGSRATCATDESAVIVGNVRLDNEGVYRRTLHAWDQTKPLSVLIIEAFGRVGVKALTGLAGPLALALWNRRDRELIAIRDVVGLEPLYYRERGSSVTLSDSLDGFEHEGQIDPDYVARFIAYRGDCPNDGATIRPGVWAVPPGSYLRWHNGCTTLHAYWTPEDHALGPEVDSVGTVAEQFRALLFETVGGYVEPDATTWAHLSGGLDSSSVVSAAAYGAEATEATAALGGTVTFVDSLANADESPYVDAVLARYPLPNLRIADEWPWRDDGTPPPVVDRPSRDYPFFARDRRMAAAIRSRGGTSLLSGVGPDIYLPLTFTHCADLFWRARWREALREVQSCALTNRQQLWSAAWEYGIEPLAFRHAQARRDLQTSQVPRWLTKRFQRQSGFAQEWRGNRSYVGRRGSYYGGETIRLLSFGASGLAHWLYTPGIHVRHPFLARAVVEFCLALSYRLRTDAHWTKPVLRAAMKNVLPEKVRARGTKGILGPRIYWAFRHERSLLDALLRSPVLADLGCIEPAQLRVALNDLGATASADSVYLYATLSLETWLSVRSGRRVTSAYEGDHNESQADRSQAAGTSAASVHKAAST